MIDYLSRIAEPVMRVPHAELVREPESFYRSKCPIAGCTGALLVERDPTTLVLQAEDRCIACGQRVYYTDIETLRARERGT